MAVLMYNGQPIASTKYGQMLQEMRNIDGVLKGDGTGNYSEGVAADLEYDNTTSGLLSTNTQDAIDEIGTELSEVNLQLADKVDKVEITTHNTAEDAHANMPVNQGFLKDQNSGLIKFWKGTQAQFDGITPDVETIYFVEV